jgi:hypothetical protein
MQGVARVVLEHHRGERFRPMAILEFSLGLLCLLCLLPLIILLMLFSESDLEIPTVRGRFYRRWHELRLHLLDPSGRSLGGTTLVPSSADDGLAAVAAILAAAEREQVVVQETLTGQLNETLETWYGGRPLLAHPELVNEEQSAAVLTQYGVKVSREPDALMLIDEAEPLSTGQRVLGWLMALVLVPFVPLLLLMVQGRRALRLGWMDLRGGPPTRRVVSVRAEAIRTYKEKGPERWDEVVIDGRDLLGITFSPSLGYDRDVTRQPSALRLLGRQGSSTVSLPRAEQTGRAMRDVLVGATLRLREARPELGLLGTGPHPTRCPFCAARYLMAPAARCPSCGAHAGTTP